MVQASSAETECNPDIPTLIVYSEFEANLFVIFPSAISTLTPL